MGCRVEGYTWPGVNLVFHLKNRFFEFSITRLRAHSFWVLPACQAQFLARCSAQEQCLTPSESKVRSKNVKFHDFRYCFLLKDLGSISQAQDKFSKHGPKIFFSEISLKNISDSFQHYTKYQACQIWRSNSPWARRKKFATAKSGFISANSGFSLVSYCFPYINQWFGEKSRLLRVANFHFKLRGS